MALTDLDRELLKRCTDGDPSGWKDFVDRFLGLFVHVIQHSAHARTASLSGDDIDDLCAEVFLAILTNDFAVLRNFNGRCSLATYLSVVSRRVVVRELAKRASDAVDHRQHDSDSDRRNTRDFERVENRDEIARMLHGLSSLDASIVRQYHLEGRSYREISTGLGIPENSIGPTLTRARARLRETYSA